MFLVVWLWKSASLGGVRRLGVDHVSTFYISMLDLAPKNTQLATAVEVEDEEEE
jgi:hypothetical protein